MSTVADIITEVRNALQDTREPYRHTDAKVVRYLNMGFEDMKRLRSDLFFPVATAPPVYDELLPATVLAVEAGYYSALCEYVVGMVSMEDDEFVNDQRAPAVLNRFTSKLIGRGA